jgi:hypothetical protein
VAIAALYAFMLAKQFEFGLRVIELKIVPGTFPMAAIADFAQLSFVRFVILVAIDAFVQSFVIFFIRFVAALAFHHQMTTPENKISFVMIEGLPVKHHDIRIPANMFPVARIAILVFYAGNTSMEAFTRFYVFFDIFMIMAI